MSTNRCYENLFDLDNFDDEELRNDHSLIDEERFNLFPSRTITYPIFEKNNIIESLISNINGEESIIEEELIFNNNEEYGLKNIKEALLEYLDKHSEEISKEESSIITVKKKKRTNRRSSY